MTTPVSECRAKNGPLTCRYHSKIISGALSRRIEKLEGKIASMSGGAGTLTQEQRAELDAALSELSQRKAEAGVVKREQESAKVHRSVKRSLKSLAENGTRNIPGHPEHISLGDDDIPVLRGHRLPDNVKRALAKNGYSSPDMMEIDPNAGGAEAFAGLMEKTRVGKYASSVYVYPVDEYRDMRLFTSERGECGYAMKYHEDTGDWDVVSVFTMPKGARPAATSKPGDGDFKGIGEHVAQSMLLQAVANGGRILDCFDTVLPQLYASVGFKESGRDEWNDEYRPDGWEESTYAQYNAGRPDVVYMRWDPDSADEWASPVSAKVAKMDFSYADEEIAAGGR